ncbi:MAG: TlpA disulfide reductase family protein [Acidobacteriota bacterium]
MRRLAALMLVLLVMASGLVVCAAGGGEPTSAPAAAAAAAEDEKPELAPIVERKIEFFDFTYKTTDDRPFSLRDYAAGKSLVVVEYFAGWCKNSNRNGHVMERLWTRYRDRGLGVVGVAEYSDPDELRIHINRIGIDYPVVVETKNRWDRKDSTHFKYRRAVGDKRKWGTPFYVIIEARDIEPPSEKSPLARRVFTVSGEMVESEAEQFIEQRLTRGAGK